MRWSDALPDAVAKMSEAHYDVLGANMALRGQNSAT